VNSKEGIVVREDKIIKVDSEQQLEEFLTVHYSLRTVHCFLGVL